MADEMFFTPDMKSLRRGKRIAQRTPTNRPCLVSLKDIPEMPLRGVVIDATPHGMLIRLPDPLLPGTELSIQMMRDEEYREPLSAPLDARVMRMVAAATGDIDHGVAIVQKKCKPVRGRPAREIPAAPRRRARSRMHTLDITAGDRRTER
jgi:hypothetical protein